MKLRPDGTIEIDGASAADGAALVALVKDAASTQSALAARIGTNQTTISAIERGGKILRARKLSDSK